MKHLSLVLVLLATAGPASAQLGSPTDSPACCQLTTSLIQDVVYGKDAPGEERALSDSTPPNIHFLLDTSGSMRELPQVQNSDHAAFFNITVNGCENPVLDAFAASRGWDPATEYPVPDIGTGEGSDTGYPNLFQDTKIYGYLYWADLSNPTPQWDTQEQACQSQVPSWSTTGAAEYRRCQTCLMTKGYYKVPGMFGRNTPPLENLNFMFWGRYLNFNPPKYVTLKAVLKSVLRDINKARVGISYFSNSAPNTVMLRGQNPSCAQLAYDPSAFDSNRASYISAINGLTFTTGTPLARSLLNIGYYFTSGDNVYRDIFGFGSAYSYPNGFRNGSLTSTSRSVCWGCQDSQVIIITDGEPSSDSLSSTVVTKLRTVNGGPVYCPDATPCGPNSAPPNGRDKGTNAGSYTDDNPNYYLDDVAKLLFEQDLQTNVPAIVGDFDTSGKQSLRINTIGMGINSYFLRHTAEVGGGLYYTANDAASLKQAIQELITATGNAKRSVGVAPSSVESLPVNQPASALVPRIQPPRNPSAPWQGSLYRFQLAEELLMGCDPLNPFYGDLNGDGDCNDTVLLDANGDAVTETAGGTFVKTLSPLTPAVPFWEAGQVLQPSAYWSQRWQTRRIFTIIDTNGDGKLDRLDTPVEFSEANAAGLREYLGISQNPSGCAELATTLGVASLTPDECASVVIRWYRGADALNPDPFLRGYDRPFLLQDILHSTPISVEPPLPKAACALSAQCLPSLFQGSTALDTGYALQRPPYTGDAYEAYVDDAGDRDKVVLVGSNGGMLHAFLNGRSTSLDSASGRWRYDMGTGQELWAFIPPDLLPRLKGNLGKHAPLMDGTAMVREVWLDGVSGPSDGRKQPGEYRTVAVLGTGRGGVHRFALDLTRVLGQAAGDASARMPNMSGDFLWMWPQPCDPLALQVGESFSNFAPQPPPIGPVALTPTADDALRVRAGMPPGMATPWLLNGIPARERWVVALNGGYDPYNNRGRGFALVDLASGHTVWSFFNGDNQGRSQYLRYSIAAGLALADVNGASSSGVSPDGLFDTATVGDYGGQLWTARFWQPGQWDSATQRVNNWHAARAFRVANTAGLSPSSEALRAPFSQIATNVVQPETGYLRTFIGTGDSQNLMDAGTRCRLGNPRACAEQGCAAQATLEVRRGGTLASTTTTSYASFALTSTTSTQAPAYGSCASSSVKLSWNNDAANGCANGNDGALEYTCDGTSSSWSCRTVQDTWATLNYTQPTNPSAQRFYGLWSYGGSSWRMFNSEAEAQNYDFNMLTDAYLQNVGQFDSTGRVLTGSELEASPGSAGWYVPYASNNERTGSPATFVNGCLLWNSFQPSSESTSVCSAQGPNTSRLYQASPVTGRASCATGLYDSYSATWSRYAPSGTTVNLGAPAPQRSQYNGQTYTRAVLSTPPGSSATGTPFRTVPVTQTTP